MDDLFDKFMREHYRIFVAFCISKQKSHNDADDIVSEAFERLYMKWPERCECSEHQNKKWMYNAICYIIMEYKRDNEDRTAENIDDYMEFLSNESDLKSKDRYEDLVEELEQGLSNSERELFKLVFIDRESYPSICEKLGIKNQALRTRISRLRKLLRENFEKK